MMMNSRPDIHWAYAGAYGARPWVRAEHVRQKPSFRTMGACHRERQPLLRIFPAGRNGAKMPPFHRGEQLLSGPADC